MNIVIVSYLASSPFSIYSSNAHQDFAAAAIDIGAFAVKNQACFLDKNILKDRSLNYGDGCFTSIYANTQGVFLLDAHFERLVRDSNKLGIELCTQTIRNWLLIAINTMIKNCTKAYAIKIVVSRGVGGRGYEIPEKAKASVFISFNECNSVKNVHHDKGKYSFKVKQANMTLSEQPLLAGIKHLNRLEQVFAKRELQNCDCDDLILCDASGVMIEATAANIFYKKEGTWFTPSISSSGVDGVMRNALLQYFTEHKITHQICESDYESLRDADGILLCNAIKFVIPVSAVMVNDSVYNVDVTQTKAIANDVFAWIGEQHIFKVDI